jgi:pyruvate kinase
MRRTKIVATIGPASDKPDVLAKMMSAGVDVARLNGSHGTREDLERRLALVRFVAEKAGRVVGVMLDLPGPKLRVGDMAENVELVTGTEFTLVSGDCTGDASHACVTYTGLSDDVSPGDRILLDDGALELRVVERHPGDVVTRVERGGLLLSHKGVNVPGVRLGVEGVTDQDLDLVAWALESGIDLLALSFVRTAADLARVRGAMGSRPIPIIAKIEKHEALGDLDEIIAEADAVMVARGDLAVETSPEAVPPAQRHIIEACRAQGKPVIVATQMLESMTGSPRPTRAEASDVATAVFEGADAVMLSGETAVGSFPVETVATMDRVCRSAEEAGETAAVPPEAVHSAAPVAAAAVALARDTGAVLIATATTTGATARAVAALRPSQPVLALAPSLPVARALCVVWGVAPVTRQQSSSIEGTTEQVRSAALSERLGTAGNRVVMTAGTAVGVSGSSDLVRVITL